MLGMGAKSWHVNLWCQLKCFRPRRVVEVEQVVPAGEGTAEAVSCQLAAVADPRPIVFYSVHFRSGFFQSMLFGYYATRPLCVVMHVAQRWTRA